MAPVQETATPANSQLQDWTILRDWAHEIKNEHHVVDAQLARQTDPGTKQGFAQGLANPEHSCGRGTQRMARPKRI